MYTLIILCCYLIGSIPFSVWICSLAKLKDPREYGSNNPGSTNVFRQSKPLSVIVLACDALKGWLPMMLVMHFHNDAFWLLPSCAAALVTGHCYSIFLSGKGGKGVATALGCMLAAASSMVVYLTLAWGAILILSRFKVWLASLATAALSVACCVISICYYNHTFSAEVPVVLILTAMILWRHKGDINRL